MSQNPGQSRFFSLLKGVPLSRVLIVPFLLQILLAVALTAYLSISNGQKAVNDVASEWRHEVAHRVEQNLQTYLSTPRQILGDNQNIVDLGLLKMQSLATWESYLIRQLKIFPDGIAITASNEQREHVAVQKLSDGQFLLKKSGKSTNYDLYTYRIDLKGQRTQLPEVIKNYDGRSQLNYKTAVNKRSFNFSQILTPLTEPTLMISASQPIYNSQGQLLGVNSTLTQLSQIGDLLQNIKVGKSGQILIIERSGQLIASSTKEEPFRLQNGKPIRLDASQSANSFTQATAKYLVSKFNNFDQIKGLQQLDFSFEGKRHFLEVRPLQGEPNVNWLIVVAVPEADFMGQIEGNTQTTIFLCLGVLGVASVLGIAIARWITQPILYLSKAVKELGKQATSADFTNEEDSVVIVQGIDEVEVLAGSFNEMAQQLHATFTALASKNKELELQVDLRTQELQQEIKERVNSEQKLDQHNRVLVEQAESALREAKETAEVANRAKNTFLANITDELTTPLNSMLEITKTFQAEVCDSLSEEHRQSINSLESSSKHLLELINNILDLTKIESSKIELQLAPTSIRGLCDSSLSFVKYLALQKNIQLSVQVPEGLEPIQVDERRIRQAFINLLSNAVKFTSDAGKVWIEVQPNSTNEYIFFSVVDTGIGMLSDDLFKLFQPFVQVENSYTRRSAGTGLGLVMVQRIVELHGGTVHAESQLGKGSRFTVKLPWKK
ncbi:ATP-binding protein [Nostoc sp. WHI]|uniref:ATP-binding protein n=1 Tax=Nostoc sp. WHI TaxID=2650611 RepID=UPI0018C4DF1E|nr:ATP-binding protein [Nostoc sp. WHI]MBG1265993.1 HAMP domain-containing protein [Nostoc sp. WHI]